MVKYGKIYPVSFGFALGLITGLSWMLLCWAGARYGWGLVEIRVLGSMYYNIAPTIIGGFWALLEGFINFFVFGLLMAIVYNNACNCFCAKGECDTSCK